jgi:hypothetical protein
VSTSFNCSSRMHREFLPCSVRRILSRCRFLPLPIMKDPQVFRLDHTYLDLRFAWCSWKELSFWRTFGFPKILGFCVGSLAWFLGFSWHVLAYHSHISHLREIVPIRDLSSRTYKTQNFLLGTQDIVTIKMVS